MSIEMGALAPDFQLKASNGKKVKLSDYKGKKVVLYFYPKDMTPACTTEACDFRDRNKDFKKLKTVILGISTDSLERHHKFIEKYDLPYLLLADEDHLVSELYGVWQLKKLYGHEFMGIVRSTFIIDEQGILIKHWKVARIKDHAEEVLAFMRSY
jgi:peroxiredoxin Q/BCP